MPSSDTQFKKGQSGNPGGGMPGARHRLTTKFVTALADDFQKHGADVIVQLREENPEAYVRVIASLVPREITGEEGAPIILRLAPVDLRL